MHPKIRAFCSVLTPYAPKTPIHPCIHHPSSAKKLILSFRRLLRSTVLSVAAARKKTRSRSFFATHCCMMSVEAKCPPNRPACPQTAASPWRELISCFIYTYIPFTGVPRTGALFGFELTHGPRTQQVQRDLPTCCCCCCCSFQMLTGFSLGFVIAPSVTNNPKCIVSEAKRGRIHTFHQEKETKTK